MGYTPKGGHGYGNQKRGHSGSRHGSGKGHAKYDSLLARRDFEGRSKLSQKLDLHRFAKVTSDIIAYLHSPVSFNARVTMYEKGYRGNRQGEEYRNDADRECVDYRLSYPTAFVKIAKPVE
jgi:hypothetical protein